MKKKMMQLSSLLLMAGIVSACSIHKTDIRQGNDVEDVRLTQITQGMSQENVQRILGTPLVHDPYFPNVWNYTFLHSLSTGEEISQQNVRVTFDKNKKVQSVERLQ